MAKYLAPKMEVITVEAEDIVLASVITGELPDQERQ